MEEVGVGLVELCQRVVVHVVVHILLDELVVNIKPADRITGVRRSRIVSEDFLAECSGLLGLRKVGEYLLNNIGDNISVFVLRTGLLLLFEAL